MISLGIKILCIKKCSVDVNETTRNPSHDIFYNIKMKEKAFFLIKRYANAIILSKIKCCTFRQLNN